MSGRMSRHDIWPLALMLAVMAGEVSAAGGVAVIGNANLAKLDTETVGKIYEGRIIEVDGVAVTAVNVASGSPVRSRFLRACLNKDDDRYVVSWLIRKNSGQGAPPKELPSSAEVIKYVKSTPGAIGYIDESEIRPDLNVLLKL